MAVWVLVIMSKMACELNPVQIFVNTFDSKQKCEQRISEMEKAGTNFSCVETKLNK